MALLLDLLENESDAIYTEGTPDLELMLLIMRYMTAYPDAVHHPKEDKLYAELRAARPDLARGMTHVNDEHRAISEQGAVLRDKLENAVSGTTGRRKEVVAVAARYIDSLRRHMRWEESDLFKRLDKMVAEGHDIIDMSVLVDHRDPLFGAQVEARFKPLFRRITRSID